MGMEGSGQQEEGKDRMLPTEYLLRIETDTLEEQDEHLAYQTVIPV